MTEEPKNKFVEAMERAEFAAKEAEEAAFTLEMWTQEYRRRSGYPNRESSQAA